MKAKVIVYTANGCIYCKRQKEWLTKNKIEFEEKDVSTNDIYKLELLEHKVLGVPYTIIELKSDSTEKIEIKGFQQLKLERLLLGNY